MSDSTNQSPEGQASGIGDHGDRIPAYQDSLDYGVQPGGPQVGNAPMYQGALGYGATSVASNLPGVQPGGPQVGSSPTYQDALNHSEQVYYGSAYSHSLQTPQLIIQQSGGPQVGSAPQAGPSSQHIRYTPYPRVDRGVPRVGVYNVNQFRVPSSTHSRLVRGKGREPHIKSITYAGARKRITAIAGRDKFWGKSVTQGWRRMVGHIFLEEPDITDRAVKDLAREVLPWSVQRVQQAESIVCADINISFDNEDHALNVASPFVVEAIASAKDFLHTFIPKAIASLIAGESQGPTYFDRLHSAEDIADTVHHGLVWDPIIGYYHWHKVVRTSPTTMEFKLFANPVLVYLFDTIVRIHPDPNAARSVFALGLDSSFNPLTNMWETPRTLSNETVAFFLTSVFFALDEWATGEHRVRKNVESGNFREKTFPAKYKKILAVIQYIDGLPDNSEEKMALNAFNLLRVNTYQAERSVGDPRHSCPGARLSYRTSTYLPASGDLFPQ
ncbi:hypothetical protein BV22DRAFT_1052364, partial [Leucogyrophana mollusca]